VSKKEYSFTADFFESSQRDLKY